MKQKYKEYLKLNKNVLLGFLGSIIVSAIAADYFGDQDDYLNTSLTLIIDYTMFFSIFGCLFYLDNRKKYVLNNGQRDNALLKSDLIKIISSLGIGEIVYTIVRWTLQYYFLLINYEPYMASIISQLISTVVYMVTLNLSVKLTKLYKDGN
tara:strand:- start:625 stop:1077 length:453 start_codon:yes stop_codon:yes gene_type:complete